MGFSPLTAYADAPVEDGVYYISNTALEGYLGLGKKHGVDPWIYYVTDGQERTPDGYWIVTNTRSGYTFRNEATGELLVFTYDRVDQYCTTKREPLNPQVPAQTETRTRECSDITGNTLFL